MINLLWNEIWNDVAFWHVNYKSSSHIEIIYLNMDSANHEWHIPNRFYYYILKKKNCITWFTLLGWYHLEIVYLSFLFSLQWEISDEIHMIYMFESYLICYSKKFFGIVIWYVLTCTKTMMFKAVFIHKEWFIQYLLRLRIMFKAVGLNLICYNFWSMMALL